jgi:pimeloyl-ACP methyl ester carboxylesterase
MPHTHANGLSFHTQALGAAGAPLCMLHGLLIGSMTTWFFGAAPRLARRHRVLIYDLRGHGRSARPPAGYGLEAMADDLGALLDGFAPAGGPPVTLVGHSWGALTALRFALRHPARVARLALVEAPLPPSEVVELAALASRGPEALLAALPPLLSEALVRGGRRGRGLLAQVRSLIAETSLLDDLAAEKEVDASSLRLPVLCLYGDRSRCRPGGERLARAIPGAELTILPGGHFLPVEAPQAVAAELERFCRG